MGQADNLRRLMEKERGKESLIFPLFARFLLVFFFFYKCIVSSSSSVLHYKNIVSTTFPSSKTIPRVHSQANITLSFACNQLAFSFLDRVKLRQIKLRVADNALQQARVLYRHRKLVKGAESCKG